MFRRLAIVLATIGFLVAYIPAAAAAATPTVSVFATGLDNPRGLTFGPDGNLYVAEGGTGGSMTTTAAQCMQVPAPVGPYRGGDTARISKISPAGVRTTVVDGLPSSQTQPMPVPLVSGVGDVKFVKGTLYGLEAAAGCSHGLAGTYNGVFRVNANGSVTWIANLSAFLQAHPAANPDLADFEPDGTWYSMATKGNSLYALEPNHQELVRVQAATGNVSLLDDFSRGFPGNSDWRGPTTIANDGGVFYFGTLTPFPLIPGAAQVYRLNAGGHYTLFAGGLTAVVGVAFDSAGRLYALENTTCASPCFPTPFTGTVVRLNRDGTFATIASGLMFPTAMTFGPDGNLYVSTFGFGGPPGAGTIVKVTIAG